MPGVKQHKAVTLAEIEKVWGNSNFGSMSKIDVLRFGLLKCACGYHQGHTSRTILWQLGLVSKRYHVTNRGWFCLYEFFKGNSNL
jgi:hypothetical protein